MKNVPVSDAQNSKDRSKFQGSYTFILFLTVQLNPRVEATIKLVHARLSQFF